MRILVFYAAGIVVASFSDKIGYPIIRWLLLALFVTGIIQHLKNHLPSFNSVLLFAFLFMSGFWVQKNFNTKPVFYPGECYQATLLEYPVQKPKSVKVEALLEKIITTDSVYTTKERLIIYFKDDSLSRQLKPGIQVVFQSQPAEISNTGNPFEFDYKHYLENRKIYRQVYLNEGAWKNCGVVPGFSLRILAEKLRQKLLDIYLENNITGERFAILSALTLGYKDALDPETKQVFSQTGAMHVLAVSGLHVGIIFLAFNLMFGFLKKSKKGRYVFLISAILFLCFFALLTGLSPSVLRATLMFSIVIIGENLRRPSNIYNTLAASAFLLLLYNPNFLFEVGFQLSYTAVFGIVFFQPGINNLFQFKNKIAAWGWSLFSVSVAAQFVTLPLTLYYFHQFPTYFWLSNFIVIPAAFVLIFLGMAILLFSFVPVVASVLSAITSFLVGLTYRLLEGFERLPAPVVQNIHFNSLQLFLLAAGLIVLMLFITASRKKYLFLFLGSMILVFTVNIAAKSVQTRKSKMVVYNTNDNTVIQLISGFKNYVLYENAPPDSGFGRVMIENTRTRYYLDEPVLVRVDTVFEDASLWVKDRLICFNGKTIGIHPPEKMLGKEFDFIITNRNIPDNVVGGKVICQGYVSGKKETPSFHYLKNDGAFIFDFR